MLVMFPVSILLLWQLYVGYTGVSTVDILLKMRKTRFTSWWRNWLTDIKGGRLSNFRWSLHNFLIPYRRILGNNLWRATLTPWKSITAEHTDKTK